MRWGWIAAGLGAYAAGLIVTVPASLGDAILQATSGGRLRLAEAQGTLWSGAGRFEVRDARRHSSIASPLCWRIQPVSLLRGRLVYEIALDDAAKGFPLAISPSAIEISAAEFHLPASALGAAVPRLAPLRLSGEVALRLAGLSFSRGGVRGAATLRWRDAGSAITPVWPLGDYELHVEGAGSTARGRLRTLEGPLQLEGTASWKHGDDPVIDVTARVPPPQREQLAPLLRMVAIERGAGSFALQLK